MHTPKLGLAINNKRLCEVCRTVNEVEQKQLITDIMNEDAKDGLYKQKTAVDWLVQQLQEYRIIKIDTLSAYKTFDTTYDKLLQQAKEMEKEQMLNFADNYLNDFSDCTLEEYYHQIYGGNK